MMSSKTEKGKQGRGCDKPLNSPFPGAEALSELIQERNQRMRRKLEETRNGDLEKIQNFCATAGMTTGQQSRSPLEIFPKEVWQLIFPNFTDPSDLDSTQKTCTLFEDLLEGRRDRDILIPLVLRVSQFHQLLSRNDILNMRMVCKSWRNELDRVHDKKLEDNLDRSSSEGVIPIKLMWPQPEEGTHTPENIIRSYAPNSKGSQIRWINRSLRVVLNMEGETRVNKTLSSFTASVSDAIDIIGNQTWTFEYTEGEGLTLSLDKVYRTVQQWTCEMPNLKKLIVRLDTLTKRRRIFLALRAEIKKRPFPHLWNLTYLQWHGGQQAFDYAFLNAILKSNPQIKHVEMNHSKSAREMELITPLQLESLKVHPRNGMLGVLDQTRFNWPLKSIELQFKCAQEQECICTDENKLDINDIFTFLNKFPTVEKLSLKLIECILGSDVTQLELKLPNLIHYSFEIMDNCVNCFHKQVARRMHRKLNNGRLSRNNTDLIVNTIRHHVNVLRLRCLEKQNTLDYENEKVKEVLLEVASQLEADKTILEERKITLEEIQGKLVEEFIQLEGAEQLWTDEKELWIKKQKQIKDEIQLFEIEIRESLESRNQMEDEHRKLVEEMAQLKPEEKHAMEKDLRLKFDEAKDLLKMEELEEEEEESPISIKKKCYNWKTLDYLIHSENLESIIWINRLSTVKSMLDYSSSAELIRFEGGLSDIYASELWSVFPSLGWVDVTVVTDKNVCENRKYFRTNRIA